MHLPLAGLAVASGEAFGRAVVVGGDVRRRSGRLAGLFVLCACGFGATAEGAMADYRSSVVADAPASYFRMDDSDATLLNEIASASNGSHDNGPVLGAEGALMNQPPNRAVTYLHPSADRSQFAIGATYVEFSLEFFVRTTQAAPAAEQWYDGFGLVDGEISGVTTDAGTALIRNGSVGFGMGDPDVTIASTTPINDGSWHHVVATHNGLGLMALYVDGVLEAQSSTGPTAPRTNGRFVVGALQTDISELAGSIDEVAFYRKALSAEDVAEHYGARATAPAPEAPPATDVSPFKKMELEFPDFIRKTTLCGKRGYCTAGQIEDYLRRKGINAKVSHKTADSKLLNRAVGRTVAGGEVLKTDQDGKTVSSGPDKVVVVVAEVFGLSKSKCNLDKPFVVIKKQLVKITTLLEGMDLHEAQQFLKASKCKAGTVEFDYKFVQNAVTPRVSTARVAGEGEHKRLEIIVHHPESRLQIRLTAPSVFKGNVPPLYGPNNEIFLPAGKAVQAADWTAEISTANGIGFQNGRVTLRDKSGELLNTRTTDAKSTVEHNVDPQPGESYEMFATVSGRDGEAIVGFRTLRALRVKKGRTYFGIDGKRYTLDGSKFGVAKARSASGSTKAKASAFDDDRLTLGNAASRLLRGVDSQQFNAAQDREPRGGSIDQAVAVLNRAIDENTQAGGGTENFFEILVRNGVEPVILAGSGATKLQLTQPVVERGAALTSDGSNVFLREQYIVNIGSGTLALQVGDVTFMPGGAFSIVRSGGSAAGAESTLVPLNANNPNFAIAFVDGAPIVGNANNGGLLGPNGGTPVANGVASLIGSDGATLIGSDGASMVAAGAGNMVAAGAGNLVGMDGATLVGNSGTTLRATGSLTALAASGVAPGR